MYKKYLLTFFVFILAFAILTISVLRSSSVSYVYASTPTPVAISKLINTPQVNYVFPYPGNILPDSPLWFFKALRDQVWYFVSLDPLKKAELALLFSDKRLMASKMLFDKNKTEIALSTLSKGEKYLEIAQNEEVIARSKGEDTTSFLEKLATSAIKHRQIIEEELIPAVPEQAKPDMTKFEDYSKNAFKSARDALNSKGKSVPINPFNGN